MNEERSITDAEISAFANNVKRLRLELGISQKNFSKLMGSAGNPIRKWETDDGNFTVSGRSLRNLAEIFGVSIKTLFLLGEDEINKDVIARGNAAMDKGWKPCGEERCSISLTETSAILYRKGSAKKYHHIWKLEVPKTELIKDLESFERNDK